MPERKPPLVVPPSQPPQHASQGAAVIFMHGLSDEGASFEDLARQVQAAKRLPHVEWIFPNAMENRDMMTTAWYNITGLKPVPPDRPELKEDEDEEGLLFSMKYIVSLIEEQIAKGTPVSRIVVGGFSQGCALGLLTGLVSKYAGQLAGIIGLAGYLPIGDRIKELQKELEMSEVKHLPVFLMRGSKDMLLPKSFFPLARLEEMGYGDQIESHVYDVGHTISGPVIQDLCGWLDKVVPVKGREACYETDL